MAIPQAEPAAPETTLTRTSTSHIALRVGEGVAAATAFYARVLGLAVHAELPGGGRRLGWGRGHHVLDVLPGAPGLEHFGFEVRDPDVLARAMTRADRAGVASRPLDPAVGAAGVELVDPDGNRVQLHGAVDRTGEVGDVGATRPVRYQHVTLATADVPGMLGFYRDVLGFRQSDVLGDDEFTWLRSNREHHTLALVRAPQGGTIDHYAFDITGWEEMKAWCDRLTDEGVRVTWGPGRHGPGNNLFLFFDDPAGHHIELSAELERFHDDRVDYTVRRWRPEPTSVNLWGGQLPAFRTTSGEG